MKAFMREVINVVIVLALIWFGMYVSSFGFMYLAARWSTEALAHEYQVEKDRIAKRTEPLEYNATDCQVALGQINGSAESERRDAAIEICRYVGAWGDAQTQFELGRMYSEGTYGVAKDQAEANRWFRRAALQNHVPAQYSVMSALYAQAIASNDAEGLFPILEMYGWFCVLEKGLLRVASSPGPAFGTDAERTGKVLTDLRHAFAQGKKAQSFPYRFGVDRMCHGYVQVFYPE
ncbi:tetratricopeptide repeat protein [Micavibrio aeruginosavorus]|uniref:tetratricopeptide repeat protein n=1 Tax=Micavibrio aeruginosavorus TaxID=349221 RepID=UPI003F4AC3BE